MDTLTTVLKALAHPERLRLLALIAEGDVTVSELTDITGLSQPRVTQYMKTLESAGVIERLKEGAWVFSRLKRGKEGEMGIVAAALSALPDNATLQADRTGLDRIRARRAQAANDFFADVANDRGQLGNEYLPQSRIDAAMLEIVGQGRFRRLVDLGTGTARVLTLFADRVERASGIDSSHEMLRVARHRLGEAGASHLSVRQADLGDVPLDDASADLVTIHQVLHYLDDPALAFGEAGRLLESGGHLLVVDYAPHAKEEYRERYKHRRLGFSDDEIDIAMAAAGLVLDRTMSITTPDQPEVKLWLGRKPDSMRRQA